MINSLKNNDNITINLFGKEASVRVFCTGDNQYDEKGNYKNFSFDLNSKELDMLNWFINNIKIEDYKEEILKYCNKQYAMCSDKKIGLDDIENEINIYCIAINVTTKTYGGAIYPEISFYGECKCDEENGICIGFKDGKFLGIDSQEWTL